MYDELIKRLRNCLTEVNCIGCDCNNSLIKQAADAIEELSKERKHGKWISMMGHSICNVCGYKGSPILTNFCPNCGASMENEQ